MPDEELPVHYGGFKRENDFKLCNSNGVFSERTLKVIDEICADEVGGAAITWQVSVLEHCHHSEELEYCLAR
ncbi:hypothetical protein Q3G72_014067 [Acer saccharum]|nr:hypothetical protein Q3G72_014067 [Acer saccharum]